MKNVKTVASNKVKGNLSHHNVLGVSKVGFKMSGKNL